MKIPHYFIQEYGPAASFLWVRKNTMKGEWRPWIAAYKNIWGRCNNPRVNRFTSYGGSGIKCLLTGKDLKRIFYKQKGWLLKSPSIDRINSKKNYSIGNVRWIEFDENRALKGLRNEIKSKEAKTLLNKCKAAFKKNKWTLYDQRQFGWMVIKSIVCSR